MFLEKVLLVLIGQDRPLMAKIVTTTPNTFRFVFVFVELQVLISKL